ncbi:ECF transporter S component [Lihuaxuella thermophila]|uniref:Energy-coupling factor transport system substrate-specific component n=1 Tax=Lihuaxuella thermophila TaxID=1173111 RepID=A0A1H8CWL5_9BACL|nr:ECF transporter S component [Lihuaxuella thermophila]SEM99272.1 energy-coupling factor transport system substrate-specific component [Lihuaxuella thermophila]
MDKRNIWSFRFTTASLVLIPVAIGINYLGKLFANILKLPLWLDSIGTILASLLAGPIVGAVSGAVNNIIFGLTADPISFVYAISSVAIGLVAGILAAKGWFDSFGKMLMAGLVIGVSVAIVSTPLNIIFWGGQTGNLWGDALFALLMAQGMPMWLASFLNEITVDLPDKLVTVFVSTIIFRRLPHQLLHMYRHDDKIETL